MSTSFRPYISKKQLVEILDPQSNKKVYLYIFDIKFTTNKVYIWQIKKKYSDFQEFYVSLNKETQAGYLSVVPALPGGIKFDSSSHEEKFMQLENYLQRLESINDVCRNKYFWEFLEVSALSFDGSSKKRKEGYVLKRTGGKVVNEKMCCNLGKHFKRLQRRWMIVKDNMIGYLSSNTKEILHEVLIYKGRFEINYGVEATGYEDGVLITTTRRNLMFRAGDVINRIEWVKAITEAYEESEWFNHYPRFDSSFPLRMHNNAKWYIDGQNYYNDVLKALTSATKEVYISDWWLSPELYLKRPNISYPDSQLLDVLGKLADKGVTVCVHLYKEVSFVLSLNSLHTKKVLKARSPNIKVIRHPHRSVVGGQFLWSHHEKIVCIDHDVAFIGGLDLCYGRYDTPEHTLVDTIYPYTWNGIEYSNVRVLDFTDVEEWERDIIDRNSIPRMPWHDVAVKIVGKAAGDITLHFIELWNHVMTDITGDYWKDKDLLHPKPAQEQELNLYSTILEYPSITENLSLQKPQEIEFSRNQEKIRSFSMISNPSSYSRIDALALDKLIDQEEGPNNMILYNFSTKSKNEYEDKKIFSTRFRNYSLLPTNTSKSREQLEFQDEILFREEIEADQAQGDEAWAKNLLLPKFNKLKTTGCCNCQIVRSAGLWSMGLEKKEHSIHAAYLHLILEAKNFIYIENQFFISSTAGCPVKNQIAQALIERIKIAAAEKENFKVIVIMPLLPGFQGRIQDSSLLRVQLHWEYQTICRGLSSIYEQLKLDKNIINPDDYISFYSLRNHGILNTKPVTEIVYIHSKLMIIDDDIAILGSANINDRSMLGNKDSEIAVIVTDENKIDTVLAGENKKVSEFSYSLRISLFKEFLNNQNEEVIRDPLSDKFTSLWMTTAQNNTSLYRHIFRSCPDDEIETLDHIEPFQKKANIDEYMALKDSFQGLLVQFPLKFLERENLKISIFNKEYLLPDENFI